MKIERMMRWFLSIFLSVLLVSPFALKVYAEEGPDYSLDTESAVVLHPDLTGSTNKLTEVIAMWTYGGDAYILFESSTALATVTMDGAAALDLNDFEKKESVTIGGVTYVPVKNNSFFTVARFDVSKVGTGSTHSLMVTAQGGGHEIGEGVLTTVSEKAEVSVAKKWDGGPMNDVKVHLYGMDKSVSIESFEFDSELVNTATVEDLPYTDGLGRVIQYTVAEDKATMEEGYSVTLDKDYINAQGLHKYGFTITNTYTRPAVDIVVEKKWHGDNKVDKPKFITLNLYYLDDQEVRVDVASKDVYPDMDGLWKHTFENQYKYDENYDAIDYKVEEEAVPGFSTYIEKIDAARFIVHNTELLSIEGTKTWMDDPQTSATTRPDSITVELYRNNVLYRSKTVMPDTSGNWTYRFDSLEELDAEGEAYTYTIEEADVDGYISGVNGYDLVNIQSMDISGTKRWLDEPETDKRPEYIEVVLLQNEEAFKTLKVMPDGEGAWRYSFTDLPKYDANGALYKYSIDEVEVDGYETETDGYDLTNIRTDIISVTGTKTWMDEPHTESRPESITVVLLQNEDEFKTMEVKPDEADKWAYSFHDLPEFDKNGVPYAYTINELEVEGYETMVEGFDLINTRVGTTSVSGTKTWMDEPETEMRPEYIEVVLLQNEEEYRTMKVLPDEQGNWTYGFNELPQFDEYGMAYEYAIDELEVEGYETTVEGFDLINTRVGTTSVSGTKTWMDEPETEMRPEYIEVVLLQNDEKYETLEVMPDTEGNWTYTFSDLPEFDAEGKPYEYSIDELEVEGYLSTVDGYDLINTRTGSVSISGEKTWDDLSDRPEEITVLLLENGVEVDRMKVTPNASGAWLYTFLNQHEFDEEGIPYTYSVEELSVAGYETTVDGYDLHNRQQRGMIRILKTDNFNEPLEGGEFEIHDEKGVLVYSGISDENGIVEALLPLGTYKVMEVEAPEDFILDETPKMAVLDTDGEVIELSFVNDPEINELPDTGGDEDPGEEEPEEEDIKDKTEDEKPELPKTGGIHYSFWSLQGILLIMGGLLLLKRRKTA